MVNFVITQITCMCEVNLQPGRSPKSKDTEIKKHHNIKFVENIRLQDKIMKINKN